MMGRMQSSFGDKWQLNNVSPLTVRAMFPTKKVWFLFFSFFVLIFTFTYSYWLKKQEEDAMTDECFKEM